MFEKSLRDHRLRYKQIGFKSHIMRYWQSPSYRIIWLMRLAQTISNKPLRKFINLIFTKNCNKFGFSLSPVTEIGDGVLFPHNGPIVINPKSRIGRNVIIHPCVLIGGDRQNHRAPTIGDNVFIGHGSKIIGDVYIGNDVFISPGAVITKSISSDAVVGSGVNNILRVIGGGY